MVDFLDVVEKPECLLWDTPKLERPEPIRQSLESGNTQASALWSGLINIVIGLISRKSMIAARTSRKLQHFWNIIPYLVCGCANWCMDVLGWDSLDLNGCALLPGPKSSDVDVKNSTTFSYHKGLDVSVRDTFMGWVKYAEDSDALMPMRRKGVTVWGYSCLEGSE